MDSIITGKIKIELKDLIISIESNGYSLSDLAQKDISEKFNEPLSYEEYIDKITEKLDKIKKEHNYDFNIEEFNKPEHKDNIKSAKERIKEIIQEFNNVKVKEVCLYEPPLTFVNVNRGGKFIKQVKILENKAIHIPIPVEDKKEQHLDSAIRLMENANYYVNIERNNKNKYKLKLSSSGETPPHCIRPYRGGGGGWNISFPNMLFYGEIVLFEENNERPFFFTIPVVIYPQKLNPEECIDIVNDLLELHSELILDYSTVTGLSLVPGEYGKKTPIQRIKFIDYIWKRRNLKLVLQNIIDNPHKVLISEDVYKNIEEVTFVSPYRLMDMITSADGLQEVNQGHFSAGGRSFIFTKAYDEVTRISHDTYPNRFVKFFIHYLYTELNSLIASLESMEKESLVVSKYFENYLKIAMEIKNKNLLRFLHHDFFNEVSDLRHLNVPPQTMLKEERYSTVFKSYLELIKGLLTDEKLEELLKDPIKNMPELYEYWCFLKVWKLLNGEGKGTPYFEIEEGDGDKEISKWEIEWNDKKLIYQKHISPDNRNDYFSYSLPLTPDIYLKSDNHLIIFDAKYRVDFVEEIEKMTGGENKSGESERKEGELEKIIQEEHRGTFKLADLYKMHTYREAIIRRIKEKDGKTKLKRPVWVVALYPGDILALFPTKGQKLIARIIITNGNLQCKILKDKKEYPAEYEKVEGNKIKFESLSGGSQNFEFSLTAGVGAIPFRPELLEHEKYTQLLRGIFAKFLRNK